MNTAIQSPTGGSGGIGFAVPVDVIRRVAPALIANGRYAHPYLGVSLGELGYEIEPGQTGVQRGLLVLEIEPNSSAASSDLRPARVRRQGRQLIYSGGDIITAVNGNPVETRDDLTLYMESEVRPGETISLTVYRDGEQEQIEITVGAR